MLTKQSQTEVPGSSARGAIVRNSSCIVAGLQIKGEIFGDADLQIDGNVEGTIALPGQNLTVGRSGQLSCNVDAREVLVYGKVLGNLIATDLIEIKKDGSVIGDIRAPRISIEDGAYFKGYIDMEDPHMPAPAILRKPIVPTDGAANRSQGRSDERPVRTHEPG